MEAHAYSRVTRRPAVCMGASGPGATNLVTGVANAWIDAAPLIDGERVDWEPDAVTITPPTRFHSHHNDGDGMALFLIFQDGGLYYYGRTMGFAFA